MLALDARAAGVDAPPSASARYKPSRSPRYTDTRSTAPSAPSNSLPTRAPVLSSSACSAWETPGASSMVIVLPLPISRVPLRSFVPRFGALRRPRAVRLGHRPDHRIVGHAPPHAHAG